MSKPAAASATKLPQFPQKSAWARGPPNTSSTPTPRSQSPAPTSATSPVATSHSRRPSTLGQAVAFKDGVGVRNSTSATPSASPVTFGSIDDAAATISSSPASVPPIKTEVPQRFGSVSATPSPVSTVNGKQPASTSASVSSTVKPSHVTKPPGFNVKSLFMTHTSTGPAPSSSSQNSSEPAASASPSTRPAPLPSYPSSSQPLSHTPQSAQFPSHSFQTFVPGSGLRPQPNGTNTNGPPRSPVYSRPAPNGVAPVGVNGRPQGPPGTPAAPPTPLSANIPSPRMGHPHPAAQPQMPPGQQPVPWQYYYPYPNMPPEYMYASGWHVPQHVVPPGQHPAGPQPPPHQPPHQHAQPGMPMSPRHPPSTLHPPGTPNLTPSVPSPAPIPSPHLHPTPLSSVSTPPTTPASSNGPSAASMDRNAKPFVPGRKITIKNEQGVEVPLDSFKKHSSQSSISGFQSPVVPSSPARVPIRMETPEAKSKRLAEEERQKKEKEDAEKAKKEAEEQAKREEEQRAQKAKDEEERKQKEAQEAERKAKEEEERKKKEAEEAEQQKKLEEEERLKKDEEEKQRKEQEAQEKARKEEAEKEQLKREEEERAKRQQEEQEAKERAAKEAESASSAVTTEGTAAPSASDAKPEAKEEGEIDESEKAAENDEIRDKVSDRPPLRLDTTLDRKRPGPLDLSGTKGPIAPALPSALASARIIDDINRVEYPEGIKSPKVELNVNAKDGKFKYDRDFLLQFMAICKEKPDSLPPLDAIGLEPSDQNYPISRGGSGRRQNSVSGMGPPSSSASRPMHGLGISSGKPGFTMGQFSTPSGAKVGSMSSEDRFAMSNRTASMSGAPGLPFGGRPSPMSRSSSQGGPGGVPMGSNRTRSKRGEKRNTNSNMAQSFANASASLAAALEPVAPLEVSANRWTPNSLGKKPAAVNEDSPEVVERKVKALLNKLTMEKFDSISDQIIAWANKSEKEKDGRTLIQVIKLVFEKATDEAAWSEMYARLCRKMMEQISPKVQDDGIRNSEGKHITGGHLFRKYLLNRCQEDFERGWASKESTAAAAAGKASEDEAAKAASAGDDETALYSDEYYAAQKAKRQGLGLIKFIGELFKLQMLTERIMHECVKKLLGNVANPEEEEIESLCKLLSTVGSLLDTQKARAHMDVYFSRMKELTKSPNVNSRMQFMLLDVLELRARNWIPRNQVAAPTTIAAVHEMAAKEKAVDTQRLSMSRTSSKRAVDRDSQPGADGWAVAGGQPRPPPKAGDLSQFGKISKSGPISFGPSGVFANKEKGKRDSTVSRGNMFSMLSQNPELASEVQAPSSKSSRPPSRKPSIDLGQGGVPEPAAPAVRRKLVLQPRTIPKPEETPAASVAGSDDEAADGGAQAAPAARSMTEEQALKQIDEDTKELLSIRNVDEAEEYFIKLPAEHRHRLVDKLVVTAVESKEDVVDVISQVFARAVSKDLCSPAHFEEGFLPTAEIIDDVAIDAPKALTFFAKLLKGAGLDKDVERRERITSKSLDSEKLLGMLTS